MVRSPSRPGQRSRRFPPRIPHLPAPFGPPAGAAAARHTLLGYRSGAQSVKLLSNPRAKASFISNRRSEKRQDMRFYLIVASLLVHFSNGWPQAAPVNVKLRIVLLDKDLN